jgi:hypothetical protein
MPFTLAHPAAIIPIYRCAGRYTSLSALVIGSMSSDFVYFLPLGISGDLSHSIRGILLFCVPAGLLVYTVFHSFAKLPLAALLPERIASRLRNDSYEWMPTTIASLLIVISSLALGAFTHITWDAFTHGNTTIVKNIDFLRLVVGPTDGSGIRVYKVLQHLSSVLGLVVLTRCISRWTHQAPVVAAVNARRLATPYKRNCRSYSHGRRVGQHNWLDVFGCKSI